MSATVGIFFLGVTAGIAGIVIDMLIRVAVEWHYTRRVRKRAHELLDNLPDLFAYSGHTHDDGTHHITGVDTYKRITLDRIKNGDEIVCDTGSGPIEYTAGYNGDPGPGNETDTYYRKTTP